LRFITNTFSAIGFVSYIFQWNESGALPLLTSDLLASETAADFEVNVNGLNSLSRSGLVASELPQLLSLDKLIPKLAKFDHNGNALQLLARLASFGGTMIPLNLKLSPNLEFDCVDLNRVDIASNTRFLDYLASEFPLNKQNSKYKQNLLMLLSELSRQKDLAKLMVVEGWLGGIMPMLSS